MWHSSWTAGALMLAITFLIVALSGPTVAAQTQQVEATLQAPQTQTQAPQEQTQAPPQQTQNPQDTQDPNKPAEQKEPPTPEHTGIRALFANLVVDVKKLPAKPNLYLAGIGGGLAAVSHPADSGLNIRLRNHYNTANKVFAPGKYVGNTPEQIAMSLGTYAYGRITHSPKVSHLGNDLLQAQILTEMLVEPLKYATRRERPDGSDRRSFPSGHAAVTFASATVLERHLGWRKSLLGYSIASYVAASRLHDNRHYLSDVVFGAAVGTIAGRTVVHHAADYWAFAPVSVPGGGVAILATRTARR